MILYQIIFDLYKIYKLSIFIIYVQCTLIVHCTYIMILELASRRFFLHVQSH